MVQFIIVLVKVKFTRINFFQVLFLLFFCLLIKVMFILLKICVSYLFFTALDETSLNLIKKKQVGAL